MTKRLPILLVVLAAPFVAAPSLLGQSVLQVSVTASGQSSNVAPGGSLALTASDLGQPILANVTVLYSGTATATITGVSVTGTSEMTLLLAPQVPATLHPNGSTSFTVQYLSASGNAVAAQVSVAFTENSQASNFMFTLTGTSPHLTFSYFFAPSGALTDLNSGDRITFPATNVGSSVQAVVSVLNRGTAAGSLQSVTLTGSAFQLSGSTAPAQLQPGQQASFNVAFTPQATGGSQGLLTLGLASSSVTFSLAGTGTSTAFAVSYALADGNIHPLSSGAAISFPSVDLNGTTTATITILNQGTGPGTVTGITLAGAGFQLSGLPLLPATVPAGQNIHFGIVFAPAQAGSFSGTFRIDLGGSSISGTLTASTNAPNLALSYTLADGNIHPLSSGAAISFPSVDLNGTTTATITILNQGTGAGSVTAITVAGAGFQLSGLPLLPATVPAGQSLHFGIVFAPTQAGTFNGTFSIALAGSSISGTLTASTNAPNFTLSYTLADGNVHPLSSGAAISFPSVDINGTTTANITILNQGAGAGTVTAISVSGTGFQLTGVPLLPTTVPAGQSLRFGIVFAPTQTGAFNGIFSISVTGTSISGTLAASTNAPNFTASYTIANSVANPLPAGAVVSFPSVDVNGTTTANITILNQGAGAGTVTAISVSGAGFQLTGVPLLPTTVPAGQSLRFSIVFAPTQSGTFNGTFAIILTGNSISGTLTGSTTTPNFSLSYSLADSILHTLSTGTTISFPAIDINGSTTATITILNQGGAGTVTGISVSGAGFQLTGVPLLPATVPAGQNLRFGIVFNPTQAGTFNGTFRIDLTGNSISGNLTATTATSNISLSYVDPDTNNIIPLSNNSTLQFPNTLSGTVSNITVVATNSGAGTGFINSVTLGGNSPTAFQLVNLLSLPLSVAPSQQARFGVRFSPLQQQTFSATLLVNVNGQSQTINLAAQGIGSQYTYASITGGNTTALPPNGTLAVADTPVGQTSSVTISITNTGNGDGQIAAVAITGPGLSLSGLPAGAFTLHANGSQQFTVSFAPVQPGAIKGQLTIGNDSFTITATGIGSKLIFTYTNAAASNPVTEGGSVIFAPSAVGSSASVNFSVQNTGTSAATISSINLATSSAIFALQQLPSLPVSLNPGATITFAVSFLPNNTGTLTATLAVNSSTFTLSGTGTQPAALPAYQFQGPAGDQPPAQQPAIGLSLSSPYPLPLQGTLTLTFVPSVFTDDPAIQFASGGRTVKFTIPANSTQALFNGAATTIPLQTGTTAGDIVITPSFTIQNGFDLTPSSPAALTLTISRSAPQLLSASITAETLTSFTLTLNGYSTTRALRQLDIQITPKQGVNFPSTHLTIDVSAASASWFQSTASQGFGGEFLVAIPFVLQNGGTSDDLVHFLQSLSITATNEISASGALSVPVP